MISDGLDQWRINVFQTIFNQSDALLMATQPKRQRLNRRFDTSRPLLKRREQTGLDIVSTLVDVFVDLRESFFDISTQQAITLFNLIETLLKLIEPSIQLSETLLNLSEMLPKLSEMPIDLIETLLNLSEMPIKLSETPIKLSETPIDTLTRTENQVTRTENQVTKFLELIVHDAYPYTTPATGEVAIAVAAEEVSQRSRGCNSGGDDHSPRNSRIFFYFSLADQVILRYKPDQGRFGGVIPFGRDSCSGR